MHVMKIKIETEVEFTGYYQGRKSVGAEKVSAPNNFWKAVGAEKLLTPKICRYSASCNFGSHRLGVTRCRAPKKTTTKLGQAMINTMFTSSKLVYLSNKEINSIAGEEYN